MPKYTASVLLTAIVQLEFESDDPIEAEDESEAKEIAASYARESIKEGAYDIEEIRVYNMEEIPEDAEGD